MKGFIAIWMLQVVFATIFAIGLLLSLAAAESRQKDVESNEFTKSAPQQPTNKTLLWISNKSGLFSHFSQLKYMNHLARRSNRQLLVASFSTEHLNEEEEDNDIVLCDIFITPGIRCVSSVSPEVKKWRKSGSKAPEKSKQHRAPQQQICSSKLDPQFLNRQEDDICFDGYLWGRQGVVPLKHKMMGMYLMPRMNFTSRFDEMYYNQVKKDLLDILANSKNRKKSKENNISTSTTISTTIITSTTTNSISMNSDERATTYSSHELKKEANITVVHWRRGDQLTTRCLKDWKGFRDYSVNCGSPEQLIRDLKGEEARANTQAVFIATNEKDKETLGKLKAAGYYLVSDLLNKRREEPMGSLEEFIMEVLIMLDAKVLITYGISNVNDEIEYERMRRKKSYCFKKEKISHRSWCSIYEKLKGRLSLKQNKTT